MGKKSRHKRHQHHHRRRHHHHNGRHNHNKPLFHKPQLHTKHKSHQRHFNETSTKHLVSKGTERPAVSQDASESLIRSSVLLQPGDNGTFASRKRSLVQVNFVFPQKNGIKKPYHFAKSPLQKESAVQSVHTNEDDAGTHASRSIDDILNNARPQSTPNESPKEVKEKGGRKLSFDEGSRSSSEGQLSGRSVEDAVRDRVGCRPRSNSTDGELKLPQRGLCDERVVLESFRWRFDRGNVGGGKPKGFSNLGNTCYLNSTLQCLAYIPPFCQSLLTLPSNGLSGFEPQNISPGKAITLMMKNLFARIHTLNDSVNCIAPKRLVNAVPSLSKIGSRGGGYSFRPGRQEDSHEFLVHLLDAMNDGELREAGINQHKSGWRDRLPIPRLDETTFIHRTFGGYFRSQVRCTRCDYKSNTYDPFLDLSLEVSKHSCNSVMDALRDFTRKEKLDNENRWKCSGCKKHVCATKQLTVFRPPLVLCLQLKRFAFSGGMGVFGGFSGFGAGKKISKPINFPSVLELPLSDGRSCRYALTGTVIHLGSSATSGHYTACVKRPHRNGQSSWYHCDDSYVEPISESTVLRQKDAYILFYCRTEVKIEYPTPPLRGSMSAEEATALGRVRSLARGQVLLGTHSHIDTDGDSDQEQLINDSKSSDEKPNATVLLLKKAPAASSNEAKIDAEDTLENKETSQATTASESALKPASPRNQACLPNREINGTSDVNHSEKLSPQGDFPASSTVQIQYGSIEKPKSHDEKRSVDASEEPKPAASPFETGESIGPKEEESESSSDSSDSSESSSDSESESNTKERESQQMHPETDQERNGNKKPASDETSRTKFSLDRGEGKGKISVTLGTHLKGRAWLPETTKTTFKDRKYDLLGNVAVGKWGDDDEEIDVPADESRRAALVHSATKEEKRRKKRGFMDAWDAALDRGKKKKVKNETKKAALSEPQNQRFQKIQASVQRLHRGRAKGFFQGKKNR